MLLRFGNFENKQTCDFKYINSTKIVLFFVVQIMCLDVIKALTIKGSTGIIVVAERQRENVGYHESHA